MKTIIERTATETNAEWMKGLTYVETRKTWMGEHWYKENDIYVDENGVKWAMDVDRDGWAYRYMVEG